MSTTTSNLGLFKYDTIADANVPFSINQALNDNWDIIDSHFASRNIGEIVTSTIPLTDAGLHLLDGALIDGDGIYSDFVNYIAGLVNDYPNLFTTEVAWQSSITTYGTCGKFVYTQGTPTYYAFYITMAGREPYYYVTSKTPQVGDKIYHIVDGNMVEYATIKTESDKEWAIYQNSIMLYDNKSHYWYNTTWESSQDIIGTPDTVRLPKITGIIEGTIDAAAIGDLVEAGLPNITGAVQGSVKGDLGGYSGAFTSAYIMGTPYGFNAGSYGTSNAFGFNASLSNAIYGKSPTVQPQTIKAYIYIVIANSTKTDIVVDIDQIATDVNGKADTSLSNLNGTGRRSCADWSIPSAAVELTYNSTNHSSMNGTTFTNTTGYPCYLCVEAQSSGANCIIYVRNYSAGVTNTTMGNTGWVIDASIPVANGQQCQFYVYIAGGTVTWTATLHRMRGGI